MKAIVSTISALAIAGTLSIAHSKPPGDGQGPGGGGQDRGPGGGNRQRPSPEEVFKKLDTGGDGKLSLDEFKAGRPPGGPGGGGKGPGADAGNGPGGDAGAGKGPGGGNQPHPSREEVFKKLDTSGDGFLSLDEFKAGRRPGGPGGGKGAGGPGKGPGGKPAAGS